MFDFTGKPLKLGDRVVTEKTGKYSAFVAGEVIKITPHGAKITTDVEMKGEQVWRPAETIQRESGVIFIISSHPERELELTAK